jgi:hypothetical protein
MHVKLRNDILQATTDRLKDELKQNESTQRTVKSAPQNSEAEVQDWQLACTDTVERMDSMDTITTDQLLTMEHDARVRTSLIDSPRKQIQERELDAEESAMA